MLKYWIFMGVVLITLLVYSYFMDPCISRVRRAFTEKHPDYELVSSDADSGSPESVRCVVSYRTPEDPQVHEQVWWYRDRGDGWELYKILEPEAAEKS